MNDEPNVTSKLFNPAMFVVRLKPVKDPLVNVSPVKSKPLNEPVL